MNPTPRILILLATGLLFGCEKTTQPETFGVYIHDKGRLLLLTEQTPEVDRRDFSPAAEIVVFDQRLAGGSFRPQDMIQVVDRVLIRNEVEQVRITREGEISELNVNPSNRFIPDQQLSLQFSPDKNKATILHAKPDRPFPAGLYAVQFEGRLLPFAVGLGSEQEQRSPHTRIVDEYYVTLDAERAPPTQALFSFGESGLTRGKTHYGKNIILDHFFRPTSALEEEMKAARNAATAAFARGEWASAIKEARKARHYYPDDSELQRIMQESPRKATDQAVQQRDWNAAKMWVGEALRAAPSDASLQKLQTRLPVMENLEKARECMQRKAWSDALRYCEQAGRNAPADEEIGALTSEIQLLLAISEAQASMEKRDWDSALAAISDALKVKPSSTEARSLKQDIVTALNSDPRYFGQHFQILARIGDISGRILALSYSKDGKHLLAFTNQWHLLQWDAGGKALVSDVTLMKGANLQIAAAKFIAAKGYLAVTIPAKGGRHVGVWKLPTDKEKPDFNSSFDDETVAGVSEDGGILVSATAPQPPIGTPRSIVVSLHDPLTKKQLNRFVFPPPPNFTYGEVNSVGVRHDMKLLLFTTGQTVICANLESGKILWKQDDGRFGKLASFSDDGKWVVTSNGYFFDSLSGSPVRPEEYPRMFGVGIKAESEQRFLSTTQEITIVDLAKGDKLRTLDIKNATGVLAHGTSKALAVAAGDGEILIFGIDTERLPTKEE